MLTVCAASTDLLNVDIRLDVLAEKLPRFVGEIDKFQPGMVLRHPLPGRQQLSAVNDRSDHPAPQAQLLPMQLEDQVGKDAWADCMGMFDQRTLETDVLKRDLIGDGGPSAGPTSNDESGIPPPVPLAFSHRSSPVLSFTLRARVGSSSLAAQCTPIVITSAGQWSKECATYAQA